MDATRLQFPSMLTISPLSAIPFTDVIYMDAAFASRRNVQISSVTPIATSVRPVAFGYTPVSSLLVVSSVPVASCVGCVSTASGVVLLSGVTVSDSLFPQAVILSAKPSANSSAGIVFSCFSCWPPYSCVCK